MMALLSKDRWSATDTHPSLRDRLEAARTAAFDAGGERAEHIAELAFQALGRVWPGVPAFRGTTPAAAPPAASGR
jgi:hypothetical protein